MHILLIATYFAPDEGAAAIRLTRLAKKLHDRGHQVTVLTALPSYPQGRIHEGYRGKWIVTEDREGVRVIQTWLWATPSPKISRKLLSQMSFMFTAALRGFTLPRPDVILIEAQPVFTNLAGVFLSKIKRVPYVLNVSDLWPDHLLSVGALTESHPVYRLARKVVDATYRGARAIITLTPYLEKVIQGYIGPTDKTRTIYNGVDLGRFLPDADGTAFRQQYDLGAKKVVAYIGTLGTAYDFGTMLDAAHHLVNRPDILFMLVGTGSQHQLVRDRLARGDLPNVRWIEWIGYQEIDRVWAAVDMTFWALHNHELHRGALASKTYEAFASGVPVTVALEGVVADILSESGGGFAVPFGDSAGLAQAITQLVDDAALYQQCSQSARAYAEQHFDTNKAAEAYEQILLKACSDSA
ncbi:MAG: glycosyltransferase family 4 protein [Anaerolineaceae bacterium]|nr:glycosyltransferase family 4 protein [Anaerolineaceae bacterium]